MTMMPWTTFLPLTLFMVMFELNDMAILERRHIQQDIFLDDDNELLSYESSDNQDDYKHIETIEKVKTSNELEELFDAEDTPISIAATPTATAGAGTGTAVATSMTLSELTAMVTQYLPTMYYNEFYYDLLSETKTTNVKRAKERTTCDCKVTNDLIDLGHHHFPRYLLNAVCQTHNEASENNVKCLHGAICKPLKYKVKVLTFRNDKLPRDPKLIRPSDDLRHLWKFETKTVTAGCFCAN